MSYCSEFVPVGKISCGNIKNPVKWIEMMKSEGGEWFLRYSAFDKWIPIEYNQETQIITFANGDTTQLVFR